MEKKLRFSLLDRHTTKRGAQVAAKQFRKNGLLVRVRGKPKKMYGVYIGNRPRKRKVKGGKLVTHKKTLMLRKN